MRLLSSLVCAGLSLCVTAAAPAAAQSGCTKTPGTRSGPGGEEIPTLILDCGDSAIRTDSTDSAVCSGETALSLPAAYREACERAVALAHAASRRAAMRAALRDGIPREEVADSFSASSDEIDALLATLPGAEVR